MGKKYWDILGFWSLGVLMFIATMIVIRWVIDFVTWSAIDSGWAQVIGAIAALGVAIFVMSRQNRHSRELMVEADLRERMSRAEAVRILMREGRRQLGNCTKALSRHATDSARRKAEVEMIRRVVAEVRNYLASIPAHELGAPDMVRGLRKMINCIAQLEYTLSKSEESGFPPGPHDLTLVRQRIWTAWRTFKAGYVSLALR